MSAPAEPLRVVAAAVIEAGRLLLVSKRAAPDVFYLPGGKPEPGESRLWASSADAVPGRVAPVVRDQLFPTLHAASRLAA